MYVSTEKVFDIRGCVMTILNSCFKCIGVFVQKISFIDEFANLWNFLHPHININFPFEKKNYISSRIFINYRIPVFLFHH